MPKTGTSEQNSRDEKRLEEIECRRRWDRRHSSGPLAFPRQCLSYLRGFTFGGDKESHRRINPIVSAEILQLQRKSRKARRAHLLAAAFETVGFPAKSAGIASVDRAAQSFDPVGQ